MLATWMGAATARRTSTQAEARIADAQQKLMTACRELLGETPSSFQEG